ncbi:MAG: hypothetical protein Ct9H300mP13_3520 [Gammaproteobacteria bacterium]|nr:MAG: hypothetical protein Ct9H300mP13_3520 [Gammaproteobacteria bacterium]
MGLIDQRLDWLLYSEFSVILAFVHLYTLFMIVPIFNSMLRIDESLLEAAYDAGASGLGDVGERGYSLVSARYRYWLNLCDYDHHG